MSYEELCNITNGRVEEMDEAIRLLTARDAGKAFSIRLRSSTSSLERPET